MPTPPTQPLSPQPNPPWNIWKIIGIILISAVVVFSLLAWYGFHLEKQDQNVLNNNPQDNTMNTLTIEKIQSLKFASDVGNDYFIGSPEEQNKIVDMFVKDNSNSDSVMDGEYDKQMNKLHALLNITASLGYYPLITTVDQSIEVASFTKMQQQEAILAIISELKKQGGKPEDFFARFDPYQATADLHIRLVSRDNFKIEDLPNIKEPNSGRTAIYDLRSKKVIFQSW